MGDLEDPDVSCAAREGEVGWDEKPSAPFVHARGQIFSADVSCAELGDTGGAPCGVRECKLHVGDGRRQCGRARRRVVGRVHLPGHLWRGRERIRGIRDQRKSGDVGGGSRADTKVSRNSRCRNRGNPAFRQNDVVFRGPKIHGNARKDCAGTARTAGTSGTASRTPAACSSLTAVTCSCGGGGPTARASKRE